MMTEMAEKKIQDKDRLAIIAISDLAEIEERDLTCCLCLKRIDPEEFNDLATVPFMTGKLGLFFCAGCHGELKGLKEVNYAKYYALLQLMEEKIIELRKRILEAEKLVKRREGERGRPHRLTNLGFKVLAKWCNNGENQLDLEEYVDDIKEGWKELTGEENTGDLEKYISEIRTEQS